MNYVWLILTTLFTLFIFCNSCPQGYESGHLSALAAGFVMHVADFLQISVSGDVEHTLRKLAHFIEFACLSWLICKTYASFGVSNRASNGYILFFCLLVAAVDEYIQLFSSGRTSMVRDVLLDFSGAFCMWLFYRICQWR